MITFSKFRKALKNAGLPNTKHTIIKYERLGVIAYPKNPIKYASRKDRAYTDEEVQENIKRIRAHRKELKNKRKK